MKRKLHMYLQDREFNPVAAAPGERVEVERLAWRAEGGPFEAKANVYGPAADVWAYLGRLRFPVEFYNESGKRVWWGILEEVNVQAGGIRIGVSLNTMHNKIAVTYATVTTAGPGERATTAWAQDDMSIEEYGIKEALVSLSQGTADQAAQHAATALEKVKYPVPLPPFFGSFGDPMAQLVCRGWWDTLDWQHYSNIAGKEGYEDIGDGLQDLGTNASQYVMQSFVLESTTAWEASTVRIRLKRVESPADAVKVLICPNIAGEPGPTLGSGTIDAADISENLNWVEIELLSRVTLYPSTTYWLVIERTGALDDANFYRVDGSEALGYPRGDFYFWDGSGYATRDPNIDLTFAVTGVQENAEQLADILTSGGQFFAAVDIDVMADGVNPGSGVYTSPYRDGDLTALQYVRELLNDGTINGRRLMAEVDHVRRVRIFEEPEDDRSYFMTSKGEIRDALDNLIEPDAPPVGVWIHLKDVIPTSVDTNFLGDPSRFFLEEVVYDNRTGLLHPKPRNVPGLLDMTGGIDG